MADDKKALNLTFKLAFDSANAMEDYDSMISKILDKSKTKIDGVLETLNKSFTKSLSPDTAEKLFKEMNTKMKQPLDEISTRFENAFNIKKIFGEGEFTKNMASIRRDLVKYYEGIDTAFDDIIENRDKLSLVESPEEIRKQIPAYKEAVGDAIKEINGLIPMQQASGNRGVHGMGMRGIIGTYMIANRAAEGINLYYGLQVAEMQTQAGVYSREQTAFDMRNPAQNYALRQNMELQNALAQKQLEGLRQKTIWSAGGDLGGMVVGAGLGAGISALTGGIVPLPLAAMLGAYGGSALGGALFGGIGKEKEASIVTEQEKENARKQRLLMLQMQVYGGMEETLPSWEKYNVSKTLFGARFGSGGVGGRGLGYSQGELYQLAYQQAGITGNFDRGTFDEQLKVSRGLGYEPGQIFQAGMMTRFTGQNVRASDLLSMQGLANQTGMNARLPELITSMVQLTQQMTLLNAGGTNRDALRMGALPGALFGANTPFGRLGDLGMTMIQQLNQGMQQDPTSPQGINLMRAYAFGDMKRSGGKKQSNLYDIQERMQEGIFGEHNIEDLITQAMRISRGDKRRFESVMTQYGMTMRQSGLIYDQLPKTGADGKTLSPEQQGSEWAKNWEDNVKALESSGESSAENLNTLAKNQVPQALTYLSRLEDIKKDIGSMSAADVFKLKLESLQELEKAVKDIGPSIVKVMEDTMKQEYKDLENLINPKGAEYQKVADELTQLTGQPVSVDDLKKWKPGTLPTISKDQRGNPLGPTIGPSDEDWSKAGDVILENLVNTLGPLAQMPTLMNKLMLWLDKHGEFHSNLTQ